MAKKTYLIDNSPVDVEIEHSEDFLKKFPNAKEAKSFILNDDTIDVPIEVVDNFKTQFVDAKPLYEEEEIKKKQFSEPTSKEPITSFAETLPMENGTSDMGLGVMEQQKNQATKGNLDATTQAIETPTLAPPSTDQSLDQPKTSKLGVVPAIEGNKVSPFAKAEDFISQGTSTLEQQKKELENLDSALQNPELDEQGKQLVSQQRDELIKNHTQLSEQVNKVGQGLDKIKSQKEFREVVQKYDKDFQEKSKKGSIGGAIWNSLAEGYTKTTEAIPSMVGSVMAYVYPEITGEKSRDEAVKNVTEAVDNLGIKESLDKSLKSKGTSEEYIQKLKDKSIIAEGGLGLAESIFPMITPNMSGMFATGFADGVKEISQTKPDLSAGGKMLYGTVQGTVQLVSEKLGLSGVIGNKFLLKGVVGKVLKEVVGDNIGKKITNNTILKTATKVLSSGAAEFESGAAGYAGEEGTKQIADLLTDKDDFKNPSTIEFVGNVLKAGATEAIGGAIMGTAIHSASLIKSKKRKEEANEIVNKIEVLNKDINSPEISDAAKSSMQQSVQKLSEDLLEKSQEDIKETETLSKEGKTKVSNIDSSIDSKENLLSEPNVSKETKEIVSKEVEDLQKEREKIIKEDVKESTESVAVEEKPTKTIEPKKSESNEKETKGKERVLEPTPKAKGQKEKTADGQERISEKSTSTSLDKEKAKELSAKPEAKNEIPKYDEKDIQDFVSNSKFKVSKSNDYQYFNINSDKQIRITKNNKTGAGKGYHISVHEAGNDGLYKKEYISNDFESSLQEAKKKAAEIYFKETRKEVSTTIDIADKKIDYSKTSINELKKLLEKTNDFSEMAAIKKELDIRKTNPIPQLSDKQKELLAEQEKSKLEREKAGITGGEKSLADLGESTSPVSKEELPKKVKKKKKKVKKISIEDEISEMIKLSETEAVKGVLDKINSITDLELQNKLTEKYSEANKKRIEKIGEQKLVQEKKVKSELEKPTKKKEGIKQGETVYEASFLPKEIKEKIQSFIKKYFTSAGHMPEVVFDEKLKMEANIRSRIMDMEKTIRNFRKVSNKFYKGNPTPAQLKEIDDALKGITPINALPKEISPLVQSMRNQIDGLTREMINTGAVEGDLVTTLANNLGTYVTRSYQIHDDPKWAKNIPEEIVNKAKNYIINSYSNKGITLAPDEITGLINYLLYEPEAPLSLLKGGKIGSRDLGILKRKKDIPIELRALMGEYEDPILNYSRSVFKMINLIEKSKFLQDAKKIGLNKFFFQKPTGDFYDKIATETNKAFQPLAGLYTTREIKDAFEEFAKSNEPYHFLIRLALSINGIFKYGKTIGSLQTQIRNVLGNINFMIANNHWRLGKFSDAFTGIATDFNILTEQQQFEKLQKYVKLGIIGEGLAANEIKEVINDVIKNKKDFEKFYQNKIYKTIKDAAKLPEKVYGATDDFFKIYAFENELARYKKAYPDKPLSELEKISAKIVRNTYPTYSLVPKAIKLIRQSPIFGTFVSFPAEVVRTSFNTIKLAKDELKQKETRDIGAQRLLGISLALTGTFAVTAYSQYLMGIGDDELEDLKKFVPDWNKNSQLIILSKDDGKYKFIDLSYTDAHNFLKKGFIALIRGGSLKEAGIEMLKEYFTPFLSEEVMVSKVLDIRSNKKSDTGKKVYNPQDELGEQLKDIAIYLGESIEPGTSTSIRKIIKGFKGEITPTGKKYDSDTELTALLTGQRITEIDIEQSLRFKTNAFEKSIKEAKEDFNSIYYSKGTKTAEEIKKEYDKANNSYKRLFDEYVEIVNAAQRLGITNEQIEKILEEGKFSEQTMENITTNTFEKYPIPESSDEDTESMSEFRKLQEE